MSNSNWPKVRLEDVTSKLGDGLHGTPKYDENGVYFFINGNNLGNGKITIDDKTKRTSEEEFLKYKKDLNNRTILVSINGTIGNVGLYNGEKVFLGKSACYFNVKEDVDKQFIRYVVTSNRFQNHISSLASGSTIKNVSLKLMRGFTFRLPPLNEQKEISKVLEDIDDKIQLNRQTNQTLEQIAQAIFKSWFVDFEPVKAKVQVRASVAAGKLPGTDQPLPDNFDIETAIERAAMCAISGKSLEALEQLDLETQQQLKTTAALFPDALVESELGEIPEGWELAELSNIAQFSTERINVSELTLETYISTENMLVGKNGISKASSLPTVKTVPSFKENQILISNIRPYFMKIWLAQFKGGRSSDVLGIEGKEPEVVEYLYNLLYQDVFFNFMMTTSKGAKMPRGDKEAIMQWVCVQPSLDIKQVYSKTVKGFYKIINKNINENLNLQLIRDTLLPKLLSGELTLDSATIKNKAAQESCNA